jgi:hypothetical protein
MNVKQSAPVSAPQRLPVSMPQRAPHHVAVARKKR